jgi:hypothetical protein
MENPIASLSAAGELLHGPNWQSPVARDLGVADRTIRRYVAGDGSPAPDVAARIPSLAPLLREAARQHHARWQRSLELAAELEQTAEHAAA